MSQNDEPTGVNHIVPVRGDKCMCLCDEDALDFNCFNECTSDECFNTADKNCEQIPRLVCCSFKYCCYSWQHCHLCSIKRKDISHDDIQASHDLAKDDKFCGNDHCMGATCCPCSLACCLLSVVGAFFLGCCSLCCYSIGACMKCSEKKTNQVAPETNETPEA